MRQKDDSMEVRIELRIFAQHSLKFCLYKIMTPLCELLIHQEILNTKTVNVIWRKNFQQLKSEKQKHSQIIWNNKRTIMKPPVLNLTGEIVDKNVTTLSNLGANFVLTPTPIPYMEMITAIKSQALKLESGKKDTSPEKLRQMLVKSNQGRLAVINITIWVKHKEQRWNNWKTANRWKYIHLIRV